MRNTPKCEMNHGKCVRFSDGRCMALRDTLFAGPCPFFQTLSDFNEEAIKTMKRLCEQGRWDLIEKYYRTSPPAAKAMARTQEGIKALALRGCFEENEDA